MKERNGSLDCLRSLCMLFVVIVHVMGHSDFLKNLEVDTILYYLANYLVSCTKVAVPVFVLITGYFGITLKNKKVIDMELTLLFYGVFSMILAIIIKQGEIDLSATSILKTVLPFTYKSWWFATMYMVLMLFSPFINSMLDGISKKNHILFLMICFVLFNVVSSYSLDPIDTTNGYSFVNFIFLYCVGRYIRKYGMFHIKNRNIYLVAYFIFSFIILLTYRLYGNYKFGTYNSVLLLLSSVSIFMFFEQGKLKNSFFSKCAPYTFAVYLISDNFFMRPIVNTLFFNPNDYKSTAWVIVFILIYSLVVMLSCMIIDFVLKKISNKPRKAIVEFVDRVSKKMFQTIANIVNKVL